MVSTKQAAIAKNRARAGKAGESTTKIAEAPAKTAELTPATKVRGGASIRKLITGMISEGKSTEQITEAVKERFPDSQAAAKPSKHISFYRSRMKKVDPSSVPAKVAAPAPAVTISAKKGAAKQG